MNLIELAFGIIVLVFMNIVVWQSSVMISERKARFRAGTHDYYDNPIKKEEK